MAARILLIVLGGQAMASMDGSIVNVALPSIKVDPTASSAAIQLVTASYLVAFAAVAVTAARLGDRIGHAKTRPISRTAPARPGTGPDDVRPDVAPSR